MNLSLQYVSTLGAHLHPPKTPGSAGYDIETPIDISIYPGEILTVDTGIIVKLPDIMRSKGYHTKIYPRSSWSSASNQLYIANTVGVIDPDYCGPGDTIKVKLGRREMPWDAQHRLWAGHKDSFVYQEANAYCDKYGVSFTEGIKHASTLVESALNGKELYNPVIVPPDSCFRLMGDTLLIYSPQGKPPELNPLVYRKGERFCQLVLEGHVSLDLESITLVELDTESRGGFGSTGA